MRFGTLFALLLGLSSGPAQQPATTPWGDFVEPDFPFFSSVLDAREAGGEMPKDNLTPRGLILNLGLNLWACFDTDLLRLACVWEGEPGKPPVTPDALASGSYHVAGQKTKDGQDFLPKPVGKVWLANGIYPGWQVGEKPAFTDPRAPAPSPEEVGRGPSPNQKLLSFEIEDDTWEAKLEIQGIQITQRFFPGSGPILECEVAEHQKSLVMVIGHPGAFAQSEIKSSPNRFEAVHLGTESSLDRALLLDLSNIGGDSVSLRRDSNGILYAHIPPSDVAQTFQIIAAGKLNSIIDEEASKLPERAWSATITTHGQLSAKPDAHVVDTIPLPVPNPWKRNVRLADIDFLDAQGNAVGVTFDGDVWLISGLRGDLETVTWKRFTSGLHEPMSIVVRPTQSGKSPEIFVFDRNGVWKLVDADQDGLCERHELFCNLFAQTAETREFPNSMKLGPDGSLYLSKGGQEGTTRGKHNGTVLRVAPDGNSFEVIGHGLRQPFIGVHPQTGLVTASDQQGHYVPSTPLHIIRDNQFYGHLPTIAPKEQYPGPIADPATWIPHPVNPSGATQTWLVGAKMGPVNDELIHVGYNRPELFRVVMNTRFAKPQAAVMSFSRDFDFGPLNAKVNPADGQLYVIGFQVWGTTAKQLSGLARVRYTNKPRVLLKEVTPMDKGLLLRFNAPLDPKLATDPTSYSAERWNYRRTADYGSPHLKLDGSPGQEFLTASSAYLSEDGRSVFVGIPDMRAGVGQMRIGWGLKSADGMPANNTAYFSPWELAAFDPKKEGFAELTVDLTPRAAVATATVKASAEEGERVAQMFGCMACHSIDGTTVGKVGPSWKGLHGSVREIAKGMKGRVNADEAYLRESILSPSAKVVKGFEKFDTGMPIYAGILNDTQIESLILYIKTLK